MRLAFPSILLTLVAIPLSAHAQLNDPAANAIPVNGPAGMRAWVGICVSAAPPELQTQLKLADGVGLVVQFVMPKSPAASAGLKPFDLLLKLDDQWLINPEQFSVLVRMHRSGDRVKLTFLREGSEQTADVKLVDHEFVRPVDDWDGNAAWPGGPRGDSDQRPVRGHPKHERVLTWLDGNRQISVTSDDNRTVLTVREAQTDRLLFEGPIDTEEQRKKLPTEIRGALDSLSKVSAAFDGNAGADKQGSSKDLRNREGEAPDRPSSPKPAEPKPDRQ